MAEQAKVTSVEAIEAFRASLIVYLSKARPTLEEVTTEVLRTRQWLETDQRRFWEKELKNRQKKLERAQAELFGAMMSKLEEASAGQHMAVRHAQEAVREAEHKLGLLKRWNRELENRSEPLVKQVDQLHGFFTSDLTRAIAQLAQIIKSLEAYADVAPPNTTPATSSETPTDQSPDAAGAAPGEEGEPA
jgi:hypothetical protein